MRALDLFLPVLRNGQDLGKGFLAGMAEEIVMGHTASGKFWLNISEF